MHEVECVHRKRDHHAIEDVWALTVSMHDCRRSDLRVRTEEDLVVGDGTIEAVGEFDDTVDRPARTAVREVVGTLMTLYVRTGYR